jgi:peptide subunit release factor 1 (eRF1)
MEKELLQEFIEWAKNCGGDAFYIFEETEQAIEIFLEFKNL